MNKIKVLIVEDEMIIADTISEAIESFGYESFEPEITYSGALESIDEHKPDIGIFDIQLSGKKTGIDLAKIVQEKYKFPFIFLTSNSDKFTLDEAKLTEPSAFLVKPFNNDELFASIELALYNYSIQKEKHVKSLNKLINNAIFIKEKSGLVRLNYSDIVYLKSDNVYIDIKTVKGKIYTVRSTIGEYQNKLNENFLRIHRSYIVNLEYLEVVNHVEAIINEEVIPIGNKYKDDLLSIIQKG